MMRNYKNCIAFMVLIIVNLLNIQAQEPSKAPIRLAIAGMTHDHIGFILGRKDKQDFSLVGICEPNRELALRLAKNYKLSTKLIYTDLNKMLDSVKPEAVVAFGSIYDHMMMVEACAPAGNPYDG